ncbi:hypothetical protein ACJRO7_033587 [Eucalyptus globulus]|uniref:Uncharacterized protein n=1 Tax=Eucalyptus globulus TaxID=34317 RepID=A0ABD3JRY9_EUCGL
MKAFSLLITFWANSNLFVKASPINREFSSIMKFTNKEVSVVKERQGNYTFIADHDTFRVIPDEVASEEAHNAHRQHRLHTWVFNIAAQEQAAQEAAHHAHPWDLPHVFNAAAQDLAMLIFERILFGCSKFFLMIYPRTQEPRINSNYKAAQEEAHHAHHWDLPQVFNAAAQDLAMLIFEKNLFGCSRLLYFVQTHASTLSGQPAPREKHEEEIQKKLGVRKAPPIKSSVQALDLTKWSKTDNNLTVTAEEIKRFPHLRLLWLHNITCQGDFTGCLSELKWISVFYPDKSSERHPRFEATNLNLENVVVGNFVGHGFTDDHVRGLIKDGRKLKVLTLENNTLIYRTPTFSQYLVLEKLSISKCSSLMEIDCSIGNLQWLTDLSIESCQSLGKLPEQIGELPNLQHLSLRNCDSLSELPQSVSKLESLMKLDVSHTPITVLQDSIGRLSSLSSLNVSSTPIVKVPNTMSQLCCLQTLDLEHCHKLQELPELPRSLTTLRLRSSSLQTVPNLSNLTNIVELLLSDGSESDTTSNIKTCDLQWIGRLSKLRKQHLCLLNVRAPPTELGPLSLLKELTMNGLDFESLEQLPSNLTVLELDRTQVKQVQLDGLPQLEKLTIRRCELVKRLSFPSSLRKLREAEVSSCTGLVEVHFLGALISLEELCIEDCKSLERFVNPSEEPGCNELQATKLTNGRRRVSIVSSFLKMLQVFQVLRCPELEEIQFASTFKPLGVFSVEGCTSLKRIDGLSNLKNLTRLGIVECESLQVVEGMDELERLEQLKVHRCKSMERIIDVSSSKIPKECRIQMRDCGELLDTGPDDSSTTWESYREKTLNAPTQVSDSEFNTTFYDCETEIATRDLLSEQQDDGDEHEDGDKVDGKEDDNSEHSGKEDDDFLSWKDDGDEHEDSDKVDGKEDDNSEDNGKEDDDDDNHVHIDDDDGKEDDDDDNHMMMMARRMMMTMTMCMWTMRMMIAKMMRMCIHWVSLRRFVPWTVTMRTTMLSRKVNGKVTSTAIARTTRTRTMMVRMTRTTMCMGFRIRLGSLRQLVPWTVMMRTTMSTRKVNTKVTATAIARMMRTRTMTVRMMRTTMCVSFLNHLGGLHRLVPWMIMLRIMISMRKAKVTATTTAMATAMMMRARMRTRRRGMMKKANKRRKVEGKGEGGCDGNNEDKKEGTDEEAEEEVSKFVWRAADLCRVCFGCRAFPSKIISDPRTLKIDMTVPLLPNRWKEPSPAFVETPWVDCHELIGRRICEIST